MAKLTTGLARMLPLCAICEFTFVKKLLFLLFTPFLFVPVKAYATTQADFPNAQHGTILSITQYSSTDITMEVTFDNFAAYMYPFQDHDCFNDGNEYHELYNADTGSLVVSSPRGAGGGIGYCGTFFQTTGHNWLHFLPIALPTGNYWVHYHGTKIGDPAGYDWVTANFNYIAGKGPNLIVLVHGCCTDENGVQVWMRMRDAIDNSAVVFWRAPSELTSRHDCLLLSKHIGKEIFRFLPELESFVHIQDQRLHKRLGLLTTRFPNGFEG